MVSTLGARTLPLGPDGIPRRRVDPTGVKKNLLLLDNSRRQFKRKSVTQPRWCALSPEMVFTVRERRKEFRKASQVIIGHRAQLRRQKKCCLY